MSLQLTLVTLNKAVAAELKAIPQAVFDAFH
jgi:hypothetical protein